MRVTRTADGAIVALPTSAPPPAPQLAHRIRSAAFVKSSADVAECPPAGTRPEFALVGRSNVGKSSLVNMLVARRDLAQTSKKPGSQLAEPVVPPSRGDPHAGKTQLINHYLINEDWYLVDLPGYGYAVAPKGVRTEWNEFTKGYFRRRPNLVSVFLLVDASIPPQAIDLEFVTILGQLMQIPVTVVFTKCDRRKKSKNGGRPPAENAAAFIEQLAEHYAELPPYIMTSSVSGTGKDELLAHIAALRHHWRT
eukprot:SM000015S01164  [mRNA]  locus=s15:171909:173216:+ [translate_table: standard]